MYIEIENLEAYITIILYELSFKELL